VTQTATPIGVVIPVYNKRAYLERSLRSILKAADDARGVSVLVIDDGSTDGSWELARSICLNRAVVVREKHPTIAALRNAGAGRMTGEILSFIDCDCVVEPDYFSALRQIFADPTISATGCRVRYPSDGSWVERVWDALHAAPADGFRSYLNSGNFAVRASAFQKIGGFEETLITGEDAEIGQRLNEHGFRIWGSLRLEVTHLDNPRTVRSFFRKEVWHADGMFGTVRFGSLDRPAAMTAVHLVFLAGAIAAAFAPRLDIWARIVIALGLVLTVPVITVAYRARSARGAVSWGAAITLYEVYFLARITAMVKIAIRGIRRVTRL
jgi:glycosyltransferase involved in cell wall biosynthesis